MNSEELKKLEETLWKSADTMRANSDLKSSEYSTPVMGLIFLKFVDNRYSNYEKEIIEEYNDLKGTRREKPISQIAVEKCGFYLPDHARYDYLLSLSEDKEVDKAIKKAMEVIEEYKPELKGVLPQDEYLRLVRTDKTIPNQLLKNFSNIPRDASYDMFGQIYEYFLGNFAMAEGQGGGEFFTPRSVVRLMVDIVAPYNGTVFDPACGSGGMFVQSAKFVEHRSKELAENEEPNLFVYGQEKTLETVKLAKMNIAVNGLRGDIRQANTYYEDLFESFEKFDYVLANPPFNVDDVNSSRVEKDRRFNTYGVPRNKSKQSKKDKGKDTVPNGNYLWINLFATSLKPTGRAALVMANSASDARHSEADIRKRLIDENLIYAMLTLPSNMFYTVTLPATLWFFDRAKPDNRILFIDTRNIFTQVDRAHREFSDEQILDIAMISRLQRGDRKGFIRLIDRYFEEGMERLKGNKEKIVEVSKTLRDYLKALKENNIPDFAERLEEIGKLEVIYENYRAIGNGRIVGNGRDRSLQTDVNTAQRTLAAAFTPFFAIIHDMLKTIDKKVRLLEKEYGNSKETKTIKVDLDLLHKEIKDAEYFFIHINWLQERFPDAKYEDVTGLCKLATPEEVAEQDYSLNPGRYVGVVIEEDGKTEEGFTAEILALNEELIKLNAEARELEVVINHNIRQLTGEE
jgi:type I restriction enzyme M protein